MFHRVLNGNLAVRRFERAIQAASTLEDCWTALVQTSRDFGICGVALHIDGHEFTADIAEVSSTDCWRLTIPINGSGHLHLSIPFDWQSNAAIAPLALVIRTVLSSKLETFQPIPHSGPPPLLTKVQKASA